MKIYTKTGDAGETGLFAGPRVFKDHARIEAYGTVDELNAMLGLARSQLLCGEVDLVLARIQNELFNVGAELAAHDSARLAVDPVGEQELDSLERDIDRWEQQLAPLRNFILPGGGQAAATLHVARTVCRRAERRVVSLLRAAEDPTSSRIVIYLNRLSDLLFVAARFANQHGGCEDTAWRADRAKDSLSPGKSGED